MGEQKALLPWHGTTLLEYQIAQLGALSDVRDVIVVTGWNAAALEPLIERADARAIRNDRFDNGKSTSIRCGVRALGPDTQALILLAVDQPRPSWILRALLEAHERTHTMITAPTFDGRRGHPLIFDRSLFPELLEVDEESQGVRAVVERHAADLQDVTFDDPIVRADINTKDDLERWSSAEAG